MLYMCEISLVKKAHGKNDKGFFMPESEICRNVFANKKSVGRSEYYAAQHFGMKVDVIFRLRVIDYNDELIVRYDNKEYDVVRTYETSTDFIELTCTRR